MRTPPPVPPPEPRTFRLPVPAQPALGPEAYQRGPTLMAGATPGSGGAVRVWSPNRRLLRRGTTSSSLLLAASLTGMLWGHNFGFICITLSLFSAVVYGIQALRRPCYITTDDLGIGITTCRSSQSLHWTEVERYEIEQYVIQTTLSPRGTRMVLWAPDRIEAYLTGYSSKEVGELTSLITKKAGLVRHPHSNGQYLRSDAVLALLKPSSLNNPVTTVLPPQDVGIGITFEQNADSQILVASVEDHSPAADSGLMPGDQIISINHLEADHLDEQGAAAECRGPEGAMIYLTVERELWHKPLEFAVRTRSGFE